MCDNCVAYVGDLPVVDSRGGVIHFTITSGTETRRLAFPMWLARIVNKRVAALIAEEDAKQRLASLGSGNVVPFR